MINKLTHRIVGSCRVTTFVVPFYPFSIKNELMWNSWKGEGSGLDRVHLSQRKYIFRLQ